MTNEEESSMEDDLNWKMTSKYENQIFQQTLVRFYSNLKLELMGSNVQMYEIKITSIGRLPRMEDDLKI